MRRIVTRVPWTGALFLLLAACSESVEPEAGTQIRVANRSSAVFERVVVDSPGGRVELGRVEPGHFSDYRPVQKAYPFPYVEVEVAGNRRVLQPIDYMDPPLEPGRYTYELDTTSEQPYLRIRLASP